MFIEFRHRNERENVKKTKGESEYFDTALVATTTATKKYVGGRHITTTKKATTTVPPHNE